MQGIKKLKKKKIIECHTYTTSAVAFVIYLH